MRIAVAVSGGADSVALLRALARISAEKGLILSVAHMHHGIRGQAADEDAAFVETLAAALGLPLHHKKVDTPAHARTETVGLEEAARTLRYHWFAELLNSNTIDALATAHTLNDQAETVLHKLIRGAWTEGLAAIHPVLKQPTGQILRPLLGATRDQITNWLTHIGQPWQEDATNADLTYTRNRIRHQLLPQIATFNPQIAHQLSHTATIARDEESYWQKEVDRLLPTMLLPGRPVRGGGRSSSTHPGQRSLAIEIDRLHTLHPALVRRLLRAAAKQLGAALDFDQTARLLTLANGPTTPRREDLTAQLRAERTPRELRLLYTAHPAPPTPTLIEIPVPGQAEGFGHRIRCSLTTQTTEPQPNALLRAALPTDRVQLRYSRGALKRIKEVLERMGIPQDQRADWPVLIWKGEIVWMRGAALDPPAASHSLIVEVHPPTSA
jgi:tRNA(Ile)-lysidine synthase